MNQFFWRIIYHSPAFLIVRPYIFHPNILIQVLAGIKLKADRWKSSGNSGGALEKRES